MSESKEFNFTRHLIECHCILKIYQNRTKPVYHKFSVFSLLNDDNVEKKFVECNNCGVIHEVLDLCKSEIKWGSDVYSGLVVKKEDIIFNFQSRQIDYISKILEENNCDISVWELVEHCLDNNIDHEVVLSKQDIQDNTVYTCLNINNNNVKIKKEIVQRYV